MPDTSYFAGPPIPPNNDNGLTEPQVWDPVSQTWVSGSGTYGSVALASRPSPATYPPPTPATMIAQANTAGHGWVDAAGTGTLTLNDTSTFLLGTQSAKLQSNGAGATVRIDKTGLTIDLTGKCLVLWVKIDDPTKLQDIQVYVGDNGLANFYRFDFESLQAASVGDRYLRANVWTRMTLPWGTPALTTGSPNRAALTTIRFAVRDNSTGVVNAWLGGVGSQPEPTTAWPLGVCTFTFDDAYDSQWLQARPILDKYGWGATALPIVDLVATAGFLTLAQLKELQELHGWDVGGHAYTAANHTAGGGFTALTGTPLDDELRLNRKWLLDNGFSRGADMFAYPQGLYNQEVIDTASKYYSAARSQHMYRRETFPPGERMRLRTRGLGSTVTLAAAKLDMDEATANKEWLIYTGHRLGAGGTAIDWTVADFQALVDYAVTKGIAVRTMSDVLRRVA